MYILVLVGVAMLSSFLTLLLHCAVILGKESDEQCQQENIMMEEKKVK